MSLPAKLASWLPFAAKWGPRAVRAAYLARKRVESERRIRRLRAKLVAAQLERTRLERKPPP